MKGQLIFFFELVLVITEVFFISICTDSFNISFSNVHTLHVGYYFTVMESKTLCLCLKNSEWFDQMP